MATGPRARGSRRATATAARGRRPRTPPCGATRLQPATTARVVLRPPRFAPAAAVRGRLLPTGVPGTAAARRSGGMPWPGVGARTRARCQSDVRMRQRLRGRELRRAAGADRTITRYVWRPRRLATAAVRVAEAARPAPRPQRRKSHARRRLTRAGPKRRHSTVPDVWSARVRAKPPQAHFASSRNSAPSTGRVRSHAASATVRTWSGACAPRRTKAAEAAPPLCACRKDRWQFGRVRRARHGAGRAVDEPRPRDDRRCRHVSRPL